MRHCNRDATHIQCTDDLLLGGFLEGLDTHCPQCVGSRDGPLSLSGPRFDVWLQYNKRITRTCQPLRFTQKLVKKRTPCGNTHVHLQILHRKMHNGRVLFFEPIVLREALDVEDQISWQFCNPKSLPNLLEDNVCVCFAIEFCEYICKWHLPSPNEAGFSVQFGVHVKCTHKYLLFGGGTSY